jgi:DNA invertase Pin-like site-specific DNA recombinase
VSGAKNGQERPEFFKMLKGVTGREFDMIAAWSVDHPGRSLQTLELAYEPWRFRDPTMMNGWPA